LIERISTKASTVKFHVHISRKNFKGVLSNTFLNFKILSMYLVVDCRPVTRGIMATYTSDKKVENCNNYENIIKVIDTTAGRRVLETRLEKNELIVCVTDGVNVWRKGVDKLHSKDYFTKFW